METDYFDAKINPVPDKGSVYVIFSQDIYQVFGKFNEPFDGFLYQGLIVNMGVKDEAGLLYLWYSQGHSDCHWQSY